MSTPVDLRMGIDVGGTNTDAVLIDRHNQLVAKTKTPTTEDVGRGIATAMSEVLASAGTPKDRISHVMLGTTHATNAVLRRRGLGRVAVVRVGGPASRSVPPLVSWPADLKAAVSAGEVIVDGQIEYDGREDVPLDVEGLKRFLGTLEGRVDAVAVTGVFSPVSDRHELAAAEIARDMLGDVPVVISSEMGNIGIIDRENATVLNASLIGLIGEVATGFSASLAAQGINASCWFAQNDGTLMSVDHVAQHPVLTIGCGPANSLRGAAFLAGLSDGLVIDIGGTSADVGALTNGFPRQSALPVEVGGVRTNFRMPDLLSVAIGGGSVITDKHDAVQVGPDSVGHDIVSAALCFGGATPTLTDAANAVGRAAIGDHQAHRMDARMATAAIAQADRALREAVDRMKLSKRDQPLIAVGGGSVLLETAMPGISTLQRPKHYEVANAVGAAMATVSASVDKLFAVTSRQRDALLEEAQQSALDEVVRLGGDPSTASIVDVEENQLSYLPSPVLRLRVKAAAPLSGT